MLNCRAALTLTLACAWMILGSGCDRDASTSHTNQKNNDTQREINLGIIDIESGGYICLPFSEFSLSPNDRIVSIDSSCDCVAGEVVEFLGRNGGYSPAIRLAINGEHGGAFEARIPFYLAVTIAVQLESGATRKIEITFIQTSTRAIES